MGMIKMLEKWYWIAGIVVALVAVVGLVQKTRDSKTLGSEQNAKVSGSNNSVTQSSTLSTKGEDKDE